MTKSLKLRLCAWTLVALTLVMLASSIQLEIISGAIPAWVIFHILVGAVFFALIGWHLQLHYQWRNWLRLLWRQKSANTKWLTAIGLLTLFTAIIATAGWIASPEHSKIGAVHGKFGFLFIALAVWHTVRRHRFLFKRLSKFI